MIRTPAVAVLPSVAAGPGSDFALSAFRQAPVDYRIDATDQRLGFNGELRGEIALARHRAGRRAILNGLTDQGYGGSGVAIGSMAMQSEPVNPSLTNDGSPIASASVISAMRWRRFPSRRCAWHARRHRGTRCGFKTFSASRWSFVAEACRRSRIPKDRRQ